MTAVGCRADQPTVQVFDQAPSVGEAGQFVVSGQIGELSLGFEPSFDLGEQRCDGPQGVQFVGGPGPVAEMDQPEHSGRHGLMEERDHGEGDLFDAGGVLDPLLVGLAFVGGAHGEDVAHRLDLPEDRIGVEVDLAERVRVGHVDPARELVDQIRHPVRMVAAPEEDRVHAQM